ncbi:glycosyltransferase family A protein [Kordiimonas sp. SCSIO 12610]|uniref:glycosyltransferase family 2 protein n=1 Tax=Kordiimonas sp. SCSIO 12610 TaxID=2829597 RepID=UPI00210AFB3C|nr:glycosyltransferase family A protein [Kordiimonas sp. SCSIO 12610]UTW56256.1 glycosyltransferase family 2 protein [Kordiimonas sp. SCSIO 12610]
MARSVKSAARKLIRDPLAFCLDSKFALLNKYGDETLKQQREDLKALGRARSDTLVTVIMTAFNTGKYVENALRSILEQSHKRLEVMVIDDASTDDTLDIIRNIARTDDRVKVFNSPVNHGTYWSKNWCLAKAKGDFVAFHDSDDVSHPDRIRIQLGAFQKWPDMKACTVRWERIIEGSNEDVLMQGKPSRTALISLMINRQRVLDQAGFFDCVRIAADSEYLARLGYVFGRKGVRNLRHVLYTGLLREGSLTTGNAGGTLWNLNVDAGGSDSTQGAQQSLNFERTLQGDRALYHTAFHDWHARVMNTSAKAKPDSIPDHTSEMKMPFPQPARKFAVPVSITGDCMDMELDAVKQLT